MTRNEYEFIKNPCSVSVSKIGSMGAPRSLRVNETLSSPRNVHTSSGSSRGAQESTKLPRIAMVQLHSQVMCTSSSWFMLSHSSHILFSLCTGLDHNRATMLIFFLNALVYVLKLCTIFTYADNNKSENIYS